MNLFRRLAIFSECTFQLRNATCSKICNFFNIQKNDTCPNILETGGNLDEVNIRTKDIVNIKVRKKKRKKVQCKRKAKKDSKKDYIDQ